MSKPDTTLNIAVGDGIRPVECFYRADKLAVTPGQNYFIRKNGFKRGYVVTHIPSGNMISPTIFNKRVAEKFCRELSCIYDWEKVSPQNAKRLHKLKKKIETLRRRLKLPHRDEL